jgi:threonylcarbamoyladenosine tRNA methylthiotransferase MtaB
LAAVDGVDLVLGATENSRSWIICDLSKDDMGGVHSCEIAEADFYVGVILLVTVLVHFESYRWMLIKCTYCTIPLARGISRSDELENV